jgi:hypothetical protein
MLGGIFICYRREDSAAWAGRIYDRLISRLEPGRVFIDVDNIEPGLDFVKTLSARVGACDALVAVIGKSWLQISDGRNRRRLDDPNDFVRVEIRAALKRDIRVIPVLVDGAPMPDERDLPDGLKALARRHGIEISHTRFDYDAERLTKALTFVEERRRKLETAQAERAAREERKKQRAAKTAKKVDEDRRLAKAAAARQKREAAAAAKKAEQDRRRAGLAAQIRARWQPRQAGKAGHAKSGSAPNGPRQTKQATKPETAAVRRARLAAKIRSRWQ